MSEIMNVIKIDDGSRRVPIENVQGEEIGAFTFRPTDIGIIERYNAMAKDFDQIIEPLEAVEDADDVDLTDPKYAGAFKAASERLYDAVNKLFGSDDAAQAFFGRMNPFSPVEGDFYCARVLEAVGQYIGSQFDKETLAFSANARKYAHKAGTK